VVVSNFSAVVVPMNSGGKSDHSWIIVKVLLIYTLDFIFILHFILDL